MVRFVVTGGLSAIVDFGLYVLLLRLGLRDAVILGIPGVNVAKTISFVAGTTTAYLINRRWTFQAAASRARFVAVIVLYAMTYGVQIGINYLFYLKFQGQPCGRAGGLRDRAGHRDRDQLHRPAGLDIPAAMTAEPRTVPSSRCPQPRQPDV